MPFTLAHPAAVLPVYRRLPRFTVLSALVVGSVVPDFEYLLPIGISRTESHSIAGLFAFCLPVGFFTYLFYHLLFKRPLAALMPTAIARRLPASTDAGLPSRSGAIVAISLLAGAATHLLWDSFTHGNGFMVRNSAALRVTLFTLDGIPIAPYQLLQHVSTLIGLALVALACRGALATAPPREPRLLPALLRYAVIAAIVATPVVCMWRVMPWAAIEAQHLRVLYVGAYDVVTAAIRGFGAAVLAYAVVWNIAALSSSRPGAPASR